MAHFSVTSIQGSESIIFIRLPCGNDVATDSSTDMAGRRFRLLSATSFLELPLNDYLHMHRT